MPTPTPVSRREFLDRSLKATAAGLTAGAVCAADARAAAPAKAADWQIGCYTRPWDKCDYRVALDAIAEAGFKHVGLMTTKSKTRLVISTATTLEEAQRIGEEVKKRGMQVPSVYGGGIPVHKSVEIAVKGLRGLIDNCAAAKAKTLLMGGVGKPDQYKVYYKAIAECCPYAAEKGVGITIKPHGGLNATGPQLRKCVETVGHKNFTIWYDPGNIFYYSNGQLDPVKHAPTVNGLVTGMCVKDYKHPKQVLVTPGTGKVDFPGVLAALKKGGFAAGPLVIETLKPGTLPEILEQAKKARKFVESLV